MKTNLFPYLIILLLIGVIAYLIHTSKNDQIQPLKEKIDSLTTVKSILENKVDSLHYDLALVEEAELKHKAKVDSLQTLIDLKPLPCEHELKLVKLQNDELKKGWEKCREAKPIYIKQVKTYAEIVVTTEMICAEQMKVIEYECTKTKNVWKWIAGSGWVVAILLLI